MNLPDIEREYAIWWEAVRPKGDCPELQRLEMRRSFMAGAHVAFRVFLAVGDVPDDQEDEAVEHLEKQRLAIQAALEAFVAMDSRRRLDG